MKVLVMNESDIVDESFLDKIGNIGLGKVQKVLADFKKKFNTAKFFANIKSKIFDCFMKALVKTHTIEMNKERDVRAKLLKADIKDKEDDKILNKSVQDTRKALGDKEKRSKEYYSKSVKDSYMIEAIDPFVLDPSNIDFIVNTVMPMITDFISNILDNFIQNHSEDIGLNADAIDKEKVIEATLIYLSTAIHWEGLMDMYYKHQAKVSNALSGISAIADVC